MQWQIGDADPLCLCVPDAEDLLNTVCVLDAENLLNTGDLLIFWLDGIVYFIYVFIWCKVHPIFFFFGSNAHDLVMGPNELGAMTTVAVWEGLHF